MELFGRKHGVVEPVIPEGSRTLIIAAGAMAETVKWSLPELEDTGMIKLRMFRPFPADQVCKIAASHAVEKIVVIDRNCSTGMGGIFSQELKAVFYGQPQPPVIHELNLAGGIDLTCSMLKQMLASLQVVEKSGQTWGGELK